MLFSGFQWQVKDSRSKSGPGQNFFSKENVWLEDDGLHLRVSQKKGVWQCASLRTLETLGYGRYIFYLESRFDLFDENIVLGVFSYETDEKEIDIELLRRNGYNGIFVVQGSGEKSFNARLNGTHSTHRFKWEPNKVSFQSIHGHYRDAPSPDYLIASWKCDKSIPASNKEKLHINLWLKNGAPPSKPAEVVIKKVEFIPLTKGKTDKAANDPLGIR